MIIYLKYIKEIAQGCASRLEKNIMAGLQYRPQRLVCFLGFSEDTRHCWDKRASQAEASRQPTGQSCLRLEEKLEAAKKSIQHWNCALTVWDIHIFGMDFSKPKEMAAPKKGALEVPKEETSDRGFKREGGIPGQKRRRRNWLQRSLLTSGWWWLPKSKEKMGIWRRPWLEPTLPRKWP